MTIPFLVQSDARVTGSLYLGGSILPSRPRSELLQEDLAVYPVNLTHLRVWDALQTVLPGTAASDDLAISGGTYGTNNVYINAGDLKAAGATTRRARFVVALPPEYVAGQTVKIRVSAGMLTTAADTSCTVDLEAYVSGRDNTIDGSDLVTTSATTMNSTSFADKDFVVTETALTPGDELDVRISIACNDAATVTAVTPAIGAIELLADIKG